MLSELDNSKGARKSLRRSGGQELRKSLDLNPEPSDAADQLRCRAPMGPDVFDTTKAQAKIGANPNHRIILALTRQTCDLLTSHREQIGATTAPRSLGPVARSALFAAYSAISNPLRYHIIQSLCCRAGFAPSTHTDYSVKHSTLQP